MSDYILCLNIDGLFYTGRCKGIPESLCCTCIVYSLTCCIYDVIVHAMQWADLQNQ